MPRRILPAVLLTLALAPLVSGCSEKTDAKLPGTESKLTSVAPEYRAGAKMFVERCSGCHSLGLVGAEGGSMKPVDSEKVDGPNFNVRKETVDNVLYALRNGGFTGQIMPPNIAVGQDAKNLALFLQQYAGYGSKQDRQPDGNSRAYHGDN